MGYGTGMQIYTLKRTWFTQLVLVTTPKIGSLLMWPGSFVFYLNHFVQIISFPIFNFNLIPLFNRKKDDNTYQGTTWQIKFKLDKVNKKGSYKLRIAIASATFSELQVLITEITDFRYGNTKCIIIVELINTWLIWNMKDRVNDPKAPRPLFSSCCGKGFFFL